MNDELEEILRTQPLRSPSTSLDSRIAATIADGSPRRLRLFLGAGAGAAMAACLLLVITIGRPAGGPEHDSVAAARAGNDGYIRVDQVWSQVIQGELVFTEDDEPVRPLWVQRLYHTSWINEKENVRIEMTVPEDQVVLVSASIQ